MLVGRRMEHQLGTVLLKNSLHPLPVAHVRHLKHHVFLLILPSVCQFKLDVIQWGFGIVQHNQLGGVVVHHLTRDFAAYAACGACHQHHLVGYFFGYIFIFKHNGIPSQQVLNLDVSNLLRP